jgi:hypothetical protein
MEESLVLGEVISQPWSQFLCVLDSLDGFLGRDVVHAGHDGKQIRHYRCHFAAVPLAPRRGGTLIGFAFNNQQPVIGLPSQYRQVPVMETCRE